MDKQLDLIAAAIADARRSADHYLYLMGMAEEDREWLHPIRLDAQKHERFFCSLYTALSGKEPETDAEAGACVWQVGVDPIREYEICALRALDTAEFYRKIQYLAPDAQTKSALDELIQDELQHAIKLNLLLARKNREILALATRYAWQAHGFSFKPK